MLSDALGLAAIPPILEWADEDSVSSALLINGLRSSVIVARWPDAWRAYACGERIGTDYATRQQAMRAARNLMPIDRVVAELQIQKRVRPKSDPAAAHEPTHRLTLFAAVSVERQPIRREGEPHDMWLPDGKTCGVCDHFIRCNMLFGARRDDEVCDWSPSRFCDVRLVTP